MLSTYGMAPAMGVTIGILWFLVSVVGGLVGGAVYLLSGREDRPTGRQTPTPSDDTEPQTEPEDEQLVTAAEFAKLQPSEIIRSEKAQARAA